MLVRALLALFAAILLVSTSVIFVSAQGCSNIGESKACGSNIGICEEGLQRCENGEWTDCIDDTEPQLEICDNELDDDCDGLVDECLGSIWPVMVIVGILFLFVMIMLMKMGF